MDAGDQVGAKPYKTDFNKHGRGQFVQLPSNMFCFMVTNMGGILLHPSKLTYFVGQFQKERGKLPSF